MKDTFTDANFPRTADGRVYHLGIRPGDVANRILTVGSPSRAEAIASLLDGDASSLFKLSSERGFLTITGRFNGVPISIVSIGMGYPNMDFFVREARECVSGDLVIVRLGSCGGLTDLPVGSLVVPSAGVSVRRNYDYDFLSDNADGQDGSPYQVSKPVAADAELHAFVTNRLKTTTPLDPPATIVSNTVNASADSFYASQGRQTSFPDHNEMLIDHLMDTVPSLATLEMETFHLLHLASVWRPRQHKATTNGLTVPPTKLPVTPSLSPPSSTNSSSSPTSPQVNATPTPTPTARIRAAAVQMIFANRRTQDFISPTRVQELEEWSGQAVLGALTGFGIPVENLHPDLGTVWEKREIVDTKVKVNGISVST
ncbi:purine and uridine phosphorylase [Fomitiporia mediterranea MF3/22]|uniref:purine and uridine phosphorylase n=1 Tax=Fomitiporia mediterranea (strain MF3/22) TaxID=694068 RepID=UPI00044084AA|nr:purine and uridine phosphorylase [Fomitiporia mediterranea MF3/22]EJC98348.1 purine and uridine phosphorylase [Fomitiporia mediterranea MF3/22]